MKNSGNLISDLTRSEFRNRLGDNTEIGDPVDKGIPFLMFFTLPGKTDKKLYGKYSNSEFRLTLNTAFIPAPYLISGSYQSVNDLNTEIYYNIKPVWYMFFLMWILPCILLILSNVILFTSEINVEIAGILHIDTIVSLLFLPGLISLISKRRTMYLFYRLFLISI